jgi:hypothetical protein
MRKPRAHRPIGPFRGAWVVLLALEVTTMTFLADSARVRAAMVKMLKALQKAHATDGPLSPDEARDVEAVWRALLSRVTPPLAPPESDAWMASIRLGW